jgi:hypothetical protein
MAHADTIVRALVRRKTKPQLERALDILLDETLASDRVRSQQLSEVGFSFQVSTQAERDRSIALVEAAIEQIDGTHAPSAGSGHFMDFSTRRLE